MMGEKERKAAKATVVQAFLGDPGHMPGLVVVVTAVPRATSTTRAAHLRCQGRGPCSPCRAAKTLEVLEGNQGPIKEAAVEMQARRTRKEEGTRAGPEEGRAVTCLRLPTVWLGPQPQNSQH